MINQEIQSYERMGIPAAKRPKKRYDFNLYESIEYVFCFLLSKIHLFGALSPFGLSYFAAVFPGRKRPLGLLMACLGLAAAGMGLHFMQYAGALVILCATSVLMEKEFAERPWLYGLTAAVASALTGFVFVAFDGFLLYDVLYLVLESILVFLSYFVFRKATEVLRSFQGRTVFEPTETLSLLALCAGAVISLGSVPYLQGMAHVISLVLILIAGLTGGFALSCTTGVLLGLVNSLQELLPAQVVAVYAVSALCAGILQKRGRWGVTIGFLAANAAAMLYFNASVDTIIAYYHILMAGAILFLIPDRVLAVFGEAVRAPGYAEDSAARLREITENKLTAASQSFQELSAVFNEAVEKRIEAGLHDPSPLFDSTSDMICRDCSLMKYCWQKEYNDTRRSLLTLYRRMEQRGCAVKEDVPERFKNECIRLEEFLTLLNKNYDIHKVNLLWAGRVSESRNLVAEQFKNLSSVLEHIKCELSAEPTEGIRLERRLAAALDRNGLEAAHIRVYGSEALEVSLEVPSCGGERVCSTKIAAVLSSVLRVPMLRMPAVCGRERCRLRFAEQPRYTLEAGFAQVAGQSGSVCGDNYMLSQSADGKYILALSDGMGQGNEADSQSRMTLRLLRRLLAAGFDKETALQLINSMLMVSTEQESFATADLCLVNLYSGALEFIKIGASSSYHKSGQTVEKIPCSSLPAGIVCDIKADCELKYAKAGDFVLLVTDGVTDVLENGNENGLCRIIRDFTGESPQRLADEVLRRALAAGGGAARDDMTVLAGRLTEH